MNEIKESFNKHIENGICNGAEYIINFNGKIYHEELKKSVCCFHSHLFQHVKEIQEGFFLCHHSFLS